MLVTRPPPCGAAVDGDELADAVAVADARLGALALVLQVLRRHADGADTERRCCPRRSRWGLPGRCGPSGACARRSPLPRRRCSKGRSRRFPRCAPPDPRSRSGEWASLRPSAARLLFLVRQLAHHFGLGHHHAIHRGDARHLGHAGLALDHLHLHAQRVAGHHRPAEARVLDGHQQHQLAVRGRECSSAPARRRSAPWPPRSARPASPENRENGPGRTARCG